MHLNISICCIQLYCLPSENLLFKQENINYFHQFKHSFKIITTSHIIQSARRAAAPSIASVYKGQTTTPGADKLYFAEIYLILHPF
jgi:hypothetical protein